MYKIVTICRMFNIIQTKLLLLLLLLLYTGNKKATACRVPDQCIYSDW